jgi:hypothetical protein
MKRTTVTTSFAFALAILFLTCGAVLAQGERKLVVEVMSASGQPIGNACVTFVPKEGEILFRKSDRSGKVKLDKLTARNYRVVVKVDGYVAQKKEVALDSEANVVAFNLETRSN